MTLKQIIAMGGGGFSMEPDHLVLDQYILEQSARSKPKICFCRRQAEIRRIISAGFIRPSKAAV